MSEDTAPEENNDTEAVSDESAAGADAGSGPSGMKLDQMEDTSAKQGNKKTYAPGEAMINEVTAIYDIPVQISAVLGRSSMQVSQLLKLGRGAVVELDRKVGEAIDIYVNNRLVARGEVVVVEDRLGITMTEIVKSDRN